MDQVRPEGGGETWQPTFAARAAACVVSLLLIVLLWMLTFRNSAETCHFTYGAHCVVHPSEPGTPSDTATVQLEPSERQGR